jgi:hypothetical protein
MLRKIAPKSKVKKLVTNRLTVNKAVLAMFDGIDFISAKRINTVALKALAVYKKRYEESDMTIAKAMAGKNLLVQRVQNAIVQSLSQEIKENYQGEYYIWLPSDAETPDPLHQLNYGKKFQVGVGEMPGDRFGCRCGMEILVKENKLDL